MDAARLLQHFPPAWRRILESAWCGTCNVSRLLETSLASERHRHATPDWWALTDKLCEEEALVTEDTLNFMPRIHGFPQNLQKGVAGLIYRHKEEIPSGALKRLLAVLRTLNGSDQSYLNMFGNMLQQYANKTELAVGQSGSYIFSSKNQAKYDALSSLLSSSVSSPWYFRLNQRETTQETDSSNVTTNAVPDVGTPLKASHSLDSSVDDIPCKKQRLDSSYTASFEDFPSSQNVSMTQYSLDEDVKVKACILKEIWHEASGGKTPAPDQLQIFSHCQPEQMKLILDLMDVSLLPEAGVTTACQHLVSIATDVSSTCVHVFATECLLPQVRRLDAPCSRSLQAVLVVFAGAFPGPVLSGVVVPVLAGEGTTTAQADLVCRLLTDVYNTAAHAQQLISEVVVASPVWDEAVISVLQAMIDNKTEFSSDTLGSLLSSFASHTSTLADNLKFGKLMLALLTKYGPQICPSHVSEAGHIVNSNKTFLKKRLANSLKKIQ